LKKSTAPGFSSAETVVMVSSKPLLRLSPATLLALLGLIFLYSLANFDWFVRNWNVCLLSLALLLLVYRLFTPAYEFAPALERSLKWPLIFLIFYVAFQLAPLPEPVLKVFSPSRARLLDNLRPLAMGGAFAPLSVAPWATLRELVRMISYVVVFLLVREASWRLPDRPWAPTLPLVIAAGLEAALGLAQYASGDPGSYARGTYVTRDHFSGLLEMCLPFAIAYPVAIRGRSAWRACTMISLATIIFLGIIYSLSRMGFIASLCSVSAMVAMGAVSGLPRKKRFAVGGAVMLVAVAFAFLAPDRLIERFGKVSTEQKIQSDTRMLLWGDTLRLIRRYPLFGCGIGGYESAVAEFQTAAPLTSANAAHNDYLQLAAELGAVGILAAAAFALAILGKALAVISHRFDPQVRNLGVACAGSLVAILVHSLTDFNLYSVANGFALSWISGIVAGFSFHAPARSVWRLPGLPQFIDSGPARLS
jgi:O-antigen ligase